MDDIIVKIPDFIPKEDDLEYIRGLLPEDKREMFDFFIKEGLLSFRENE